MAHPSDPESRTIHSPAATSATTEVPGSLPWRVLAFTDFIEDLVATVTGGKHEVERNRLQEDIELCIETDRSVIALGLVFAAASSLSSKEASSVLSRISSLVTGDIHSALDRVSETILMVSDSDIQASAVIASSVVVQRSLPFESLVADKLLAHLMEIVDVQFRQRRVRHETIFAALRQVDKAPTLHQLPGLLTEISDALEDLACDRDVFLDNPVELAPKPRAEAETTESTMEAFKTARVQSAASLPSLGEEVEQVESLTNALGWSEDQGIQFVTELYRHRVMDTRSKLGLNLAAISHVMAELKDLFEEPVRDLRIEDSRSVPAPYSYDVESGTLTLHVGHRGGLTARLLEDEHPKVLEELRQVKADREATTLSRAMDRWREARSRAGENPLSEEEESSQIEALAAHLGLPEPDAYDMMTALYGTKRVRFSSDATAGISLATLRKLVEAAGKPGDIVKITADPEASAGRPFRIDRENRVLVLHPAFEKLTDQMIELFLEEWSLQPYDLLEPDSERTNDYEDPRDPGSLAKGDNVQRFIEEFGLSGDEAPDAFEVLLEDCPAFREAVSIQTLRVVVGTINSRLGPKTSIDMVTGWCRDIPGTKDPDRFSIAWLTSHTEEDTSLDMLTFNFAYGEGKRKLPPLSDELLLEWCRHYRVESRATE